MCRPWRHVTEVTPAQVPLDSSQWIHTLRSEKQASLNAVNKKHCRSFRWDGFMWQTESQTNPDNLLEMKSRKSPQNLVLSAGGRSLGSDFIPVVLALLSEAAPPCVLQCWPACSCRISQLLAGAPVYLSMCLQPCLCITCSGRLHSILPARGVLGWTRCIPWLVP